MGYNRAMDFKQPLIMGVLNVTPDSFSDGGRYNSYPESRISELIKEGADIIDIGGESTGPDSKDVRLEDEIKRVKPAIDYAAGNKLVDKVLFSIDTYKGPVAEYALMKGFKIINDVTALRGDPHMIDVLLKYKPYVILMYAKDPTPRTTRDMVEYDDVIKTVTNFLSKRAQILLDKGFPGEKIILDPGMGMFVSAEPKYSFQLIEHLREIKKLSYPLCVSVSYKSFLGGPIKERGPASIQWSLEAIAKGASIVRVHDVAEMAKALRP